MINQLKLLVMKTLLQILILNLTCIGAVAQNGFNQYTVVGSAPISCKETALMVDNIGTKWIGYSSSFSVANVGLLKHDGISYSFFNSTSAIPFYSYSVTAIAQDGSGNLWIGSELGLTKFNGSSFTIYNTTNGLPSNLIKCVEIIGGLIYVGTNNGISRFDGVSFTNYNVANGKLPNDTINCIKKESSSILWLGGINRLTQFNYSVGSITSSYSTHIISPSTGSINCVYIDATANKWLGTSLVGVLKYNGISFTNVKLLYEIIGSSIPNNILDICTGVNNGVSFKTNNINMFGTTLPIGIIELADNKKVFQYYNSNIFNRIGDYFENQSGSIVYTNTGQGIPNCYGIFNKTLHFTYDAVIPSSNTCVTSNNYKFLEINNVKAGIANRGDMHWDIGGNQTAAYEVPKGSGLHADFCDGLWIGGYDAGGQLHQSTQTYRQSGSEFWPGPLDTTSGFADVFSSNTYDKIWKVTYTDINDFIIAFNNGNLASGAFVPTNDILTWPAHGTGNNARQLAPFVDGNGDGIYNPYDGDYPKIKGDQALYFIFNNNFPSHGPTTCNKMGLEIQAMAYAYGCPATLLGKPELGLTTFYDYKIINRSYKNYHDMYIGLFSDVDLGYYKDDFIGCNVTGNYGFAYNGDTLDESVGESSGYMNNIPASAHAILKGPKANLFDGIDNDNDGIIDEPNEECKLNKFVFFNNNFPGVTNITTDPSNCYDAYDYLRGIWKDGTPFTCGGYAYGGTIPTNWAYPGDPTLPGVSTDPANLCGYWKEMALAGDRRFIISSGPFNLNSGQMQEIEYAVVTSFDSSIINNNLIAVTKLKSDVLKINNFYNLLTKPSCLYPIIIGINELLKQDDFYVFPNPTAETLSIKVNIEGLTKVNYEIFDVLGKSIVKNENHDLSNFNLNVSDFKSGIYFLRLQVNNSFVVKKFVKN